VPDPSLSATQGRGSFTKFSWLRRNLATEPQPPLPDQSQLINVIKHQIETKEITACMQYLPPARAGGNQTPRNENHCNHCTVTAVL